MILMMETKLKVFTYGSILLDEMVIPIFGHGFKPIKSVFIKGYTLVLEHANSKKYPKYHYIQCVPTDNDNLIPGFLIECSDEELKRLDKWEGISYERVLIKCFDRNLEQIECFIYLKK